MRRKSSRRRIRRNVPCETIRPNKRWQRSSGEPSPASCHKEPTLWTWRIGTFGFTQTDGNRAGVWSHLKACGENGRERLKSLLSTKKKKTVLQTSHSQHRILETCKEEEREKTKRNKSDDGAWVNWKQDWNKLHERTNKVSHTVIHTEKYTTCAAKNRSKTMPIAAARTLPFHLFLNPCSWNACRSPVHIQHIAIPTLFINPAWSNKIKVKMFQLLKVVALLAWNSLQWAPSCFDKDGSKFPVDAVKGMLLMMPNTHLGYIQK